MDGGRDRADIMEGGRDRADIMEGGRGREYRGTGSGEMGRKESLFQRFGIQLHTNLSTFKGYCHEDFASRFKSLQSSSGLI